MSPLNRTQKSWQLPRLYFPFPTVHPPYPLCGLHHTRQRGVWYQSCIQCLSMCVCVCSCAYAYAYAYAYALLIPNLLERSMSSGCVLVCLHSYVLWYLWESLLSPLGHDRRWTLPPLPTTKRNVILSSLIFILPSPLHPPLIHCPAYTVVCCSSFSHF